MFTGLIEETGSVKNIRPAGNGFQLEIRANKVLENTRIGDSISVNGACQTVTDLTDDSFTVFVSRITAEVTTLGSFVPGRRVNLERAMTPSSRFGGHIVQGHVDGKATVVSLTEDSGGMEVRIEASPENMKYIAEKGSITTDGISLTVVRLWEKGFVLYLIPETLKKTIIPEWKKGTVINIETDIVAKYVEKMLSAKKADESAKNESSLKIALAKGGYF